MRCSRDRQARQRAQTLIQLVSLPAGIVLTNDGHAILREIDVTHPAAKVRGFWFLGQFSPFFLSSVSLSLSQREKETGSIKKTHDEELRACRPSVKRGNRALATQIFSLTTPSDSAGSRWSQPTSRTATTSMPRSLAPGHAASAPHVTGFPKSASRSRATPEVVEDP